MADNILLEVKQDGLAVTDRDGNMKSIVVSDGNYSQHFNELCGLRFSFNGNEGHTDVFNVFTFFRNIMCLNLEETIAAVTEWKENGVPDDFIEDIQSIQEVCCVPFASMSTCSPATYTHFMIDMVKFKHGINDEYAVPVRKINALAKDLDVIGTSFVLRPTKPTIGIVTEFDLKSTYPSIITALGMGAEYGFDKLISDLCNVRDNAKSSYGKLLCKKIMLVTIGYVGGKSDIHDSLRFLREEISHTAFYTNVLMTFVYKSVIERWTAFYGVVDSIFLSGEETDDMLPFLNGKCDEFLQIIGSKRTGTIVFKREVHGTMRYYRLHKYTFEGDTKTFVKGIARKHIAWSEDDERHIVNLSKFDETELTAPASWNPVKERAVKHFLQFKIENVEFTESSQVYPAVCTVNSMLESMIKAIELGIPVREFVAEIVGFGREDKRTMKLARKLIYTLSTVGL